MIIFNSAFFLFSGSILLIQMIPLLKRSILLFNFICIYIYIYSIMCACVSKILHLLLEKLVLYWYVRLSSNCVAHTILSLAMVLQFWCDNSQKQAGFPFSWVWQIQAQKACLACTKEIAHTCSFFVNISDRKICWFCSFTDCCSQE